MSSCWKCGKELPDRQTECEDDCQSQANQSSGPLHEFFREMRRNQVKLDLDKIKTHEDLLLVFKTIFRGAALDRRSEAAQTLARFLKDQPGAEPTNPT